MKTENLPHLNSEADKVVSLKELFIKLNEWYRWLITKSWIIIFLTILGGCLGIAYSYFNKPLYTATSTFVLEEGDKQSGLGQFAGLASIAGIDIGNSGGGIFQGDNIIELYKSRTMIEKALLSPLSGNPNTLHIDLYIQFNKLRDKWADKPELAKVNFKGMPGQPFSRLQDSVMGEVVKEINKNYLFVSKPDKKLSIIRVDVNAKNEQFAKSFNDAIVKNVNDFYVQTKTKKSLENLAILQHQTDSVKRVLEGNIYSGIAALDATPNLNPTRQVLRSSSQRSQFNGEANKAILIELVKNLELSKISIRKEKPLIQLIDEPIYPLFKKKIGFIKGFIIGSFLFGFVSVLFLLLRKIVQDIIKN